MTRLVILDRDGVINEDSDAYIKSPAEFIPLPGSLEAIARLNAAGYSVAVASNQSGVGRGLFDVSTLQTMHRKLNTLLAEVGGHIDTLVYCPHTPEARCACRKPKPGLLQEIAAQLAVDLVDVPVIGDSIRDLQSARAVGARPMLVRTGKGERSLKALGEHPELGAVPVYENLAAAVDALLAQEANNKRG